MEESEDVSYGLGGRAGIESAHDPALYYIAELILFNLRQLRAASCPVARASRPYLERGLVNRVHAEEAAEFFFHPCGLERLVISFGLERRISLVTVRQQARKIYGEALRQLREYDRKNARIWVEQQLNRKPRRRRRPSAKKVKQVE